MSLLDRLDFTLPKYDALCRALREASYVGLGIADYMTRDPAKLPERLVLLRHDVESDPSRALRMGAIEQQRGFAATYFFRTKHRVFDPAAIRGLAAQGHDIGYHYEAVTRAWGDLDRAVALFAEDLERLRQCAPVRVASMHGSPLLPWDNRAIWKRTTPSDFGLVGEVYRDIDYRVVRYFSDTGRTWHPTRHNLRDHTGVSGGAELETTDEMIALVASGTVPRLCVLTHPDRWSASLAGWGLRAARDAAENLVKAGLARAYSLRRRVGTGAGESQR